MRGLPEFRRGMEKREELGVGRNERVLCDEGATGNPQFHRSSGAHRFSHRRGFQAELRSVPCALGSRRRRQAWRHGPSHACAAFRRQRRSACGRRCCAGTGRPGEPQGSAPPEARSGFDRAKQNKFPSDSIALGTTRKLPSDLSPGPRPKTPRRFVRIRTCINGIVRSHDKIADRSGEKHRKNE